MSLPLIWLLSNVVSICIGVSIQLSTLWRIAMHLAIALIRAESDLIRLCWYSAMLTLPVHHNRKILWQIACDYLNIAGKT